MIIIISVFKLLLSLLKILLHFGSNSGQSLSSLKEELLFRHSLQAGVAAAAAFPLPPHYPPPAIGGGESEADRTSLSPASKATTGSGDSPTHGGNSDSNNSEKKRSRKQKPRRIAPPNFADDDEDELDVGEYETPLLKRQRHSSEYSNHMQRSTTHDAAEASAPMQNEPEDLTVSRPPPLLSSDLSDLHTARHHQQRQLEALKEFHAKRMMSELSFHHHQRGVVGRHQGHEEPDSVSKSAEDDYIGSGDDYKIKLGGGGLNRSSATGDEESAAAAGAEQRSDGGSSHSPPPRGSAGGSDKYNDADDEEEEERSGGNDAGGVVGGGVSPPLSHPPLYNPLFSSPAAIQLGLAGATMSLAGLAAPRRHRYNGDHQEKDHLTLLAQKEISQQ